MGSLTKCVPDIWEIRGCVQKKYSELVHFRKENQGSHLRGILLNTIEWDSNFWCFVFCAEGATSSECKWVSAPEVLFNRVVKRIWDLVAGPVFGATCGLTGVLRVRKRDPPASGSGPNLCDVCHNFFCSALLDQVDGAEQCKYAKKSVKKRLLQCISGLNSATFLHLHC